MRVALWWTFRSWIVRGYLLGCVGIGALSGLDGAFSAEDGLAQGLSMGRTLALYLGPFVLAMLWGSLADTGAETFRFLGGAELVRQRLCQVAANAVVLVVGAALTTAAAFPVYLLNRQVSPHGDPGSPEWRSLVVYAVLVLVAVLALTTALCLNRPTTVALAAAAAILFVQVLAYYAASLPGGELWKQLWPGTGAMVVSQIREGYTQDQGVVATLAIGFWTILALARLSIAPSRRADRSRRPTRPGTAGRRPSRRWAVGVGISTMLAMAAVGPVGLSTNLPQQLRPSLALQRLDSEAPEQISRRFFLRLQGGDLPGAVEHVVERERDGYVESLPRTFADAGGRPIVYTTRVDGLTDAAVRVEIVNGLYWVCLEREDDAWRIADIRRRRCD